MEILFGTALKTQTIFGGIHFLVFLFSWSFMIDDLRDYHSSDSLNFNCFPKPSDYTRQRCYDRYVSSMSPLLTPLDLASITFGVLGFFWVCFIIAGGWLMQQIWKEQDVQSKKRQTRKFLWTFTCHVCFQLAALVAMLGLLCGYQTLEFPAEYWCTQGNITLSPTNQVLASNMTCNDLRYKEKSNRNKGIIAIMSLSIFLCLLTMLHLLVTRKNFLDQLLGNITAPDDEQSIGSVGEPGDPNTTQKEAMTRYSKNLKESIQKDTEFQPKLLDLPTVFQMKTDEIFTNLLIQHGRKHVKDKTHTERKTVLRNYGQVTGTRVKHHQEIFLRKSDRESKIPKSILVTGKAGIGKSMFCQHLIRDWANDKLFHSATNMEVPEFNFAYLVTFRQLNLLMDTNISLRELLNCSSILDAHSIADKYQLEYIRSHSEEVLIIIDGFDEYSQQDYIASNAHESYPNSDQHEMPVAALCAKLMRGKILENATVMITSRPDESDKLSGFDRVVEITGFSPTEVEEYIRKYFRENETMKNTVLDHIMKNEELLSCAHIPVLCALMCSYLEYVLNESNNAQDLPVSTTDLYCEVLNIFERKHNKSKSSDSDKTSLTDKLSEFAAHLLRKNEFLFGEERMKNFTSEEVGFLRACGLLHCGPPFRVAFSETRRHFAFTHLTVQEYLAACWFVKRREVPEKKTVSTMVLQFMAGILCKEKGSRDLMGELLKALPSSVQPKNQYLLEAKCLSEYRDLEFAEDYYHQHAILENEICFDQINDLDSVAISFWLDAISTVNVNRASTRYQSTHSCRVKLSHAGNLTLTGVQRICEKLENDGCPITKLCLSDFQLNDDWLSSVSTLIRNKLSSLALLNTHITDVSVASLSKALQHSDCKVTKLTLEDYKITDVGVASLSRALQHSDCKVTKLTLEGDQITDDGVASLSKALQHSDCKVTKLTLQHTRIADDGVASLSKALQHSDCKVTKLTLRGDEITDVGVASLSKALQHSDCKVTKLKLEGYWINDVGVASLSQALQHSDCKVTKLTLQHTWIADDGVASLSQALQHSDCKVTKLTLQGDEITDVGVASLSRALQHPNCKVTKLELQCYRTTDVSVVCLSEAMLHPDCELWLNGKRINPSDYTARTTGTT